MSPSDLTRWNRAGLERFRYVDGNAALHLEALRKELADRFDQWQAVADVALRDETARERVERITRQYNDARREWAWAITRAFARAMHVISEHADAFAPGERGLPPHGNPVAKRQAPGGNGRLRRQTGVIGRDAFGAPGQGERRSGGG